MDALDMLTNRRSVRKFTDKEVPREVIEKIVETARMAPSWKNTQTARFTAVYDQDIKKKIAEEGTLGFVQNTATINASPVLIVETTVGKRSGYERDGSFTTAKGTHWESFDAGIAAQTFCLAAYEQGLGTIIMGYFDEDMIKELLGIDDEDMRVSAVIGLGYPAEEPVAPPRKDVEKLLTFV